MHELSIAQEVVRIVEDEQKRHGFEKVGIIKIKAGGFSGIDEHALKFAFEVAREGTCAAKASLDLELEPIMLNCRNCNYLMPVEVAVGVCPECKSADIALEATGEFEIIALEVD